MKKHVLIAFAIASLLLITPLTGIAQENKVSSNLSEQPDINGLVSQLRVVIDEILEKYGHILMIRTLCNMILNSLGIIGLWLLCTFILIYVILFGLIALVLSFLNFNIVAEYIVAIVFVILLELDSNCPTIWDFIQPFKSLFTLSKTNDFTNLIENCPCLQE